MGIPTLIQEQNSYAGVTNKLLSGKAKKICVAYEGMEAFFPAGKIMLTGNPVRQDILTSQISKEEATKLFGFTPGAKTILILGGSLGARTINQCLMENFAMLKDSGIQFIWQTGKVYYDQVKETVKAMGETPDIFVADFIKNMPAAYKAADLVISRAGAGSISEFCLLGKPVILVPSPNVAEDHQTKNALALVDKRAALYVKDEEAKEKLIPEALQTINDKLLLTSLSKNIMKMGMPDSANIIAEEVLKLAKHRKTMSQKD